jgi:hypothetical protein
LAVLFIKHSVLRLSLLYARLLDGDIERRLAKEKVWQSCETTTALDITVNLLHIHVSRSYIINIQQQHPAGRPAGRIVLPLWKSTKGPLTSDGVHHPRDKRSAARLGKSPGILTPGSFFFSFFSTIAKIKKNILPR